MLVFEEQFLDNRHNWLQKSTEAVELSIVDFCYLFQHKRSDGSWACWKNINENLSKNEDLHIYSMLEQSVKVYEKNSSGYDNWYGLIWGVLDANNFFSFAINDDGYYRIIQSRKGYWIFHSEKSVKHENIHTGNAINILEIRRNKELMEFYINSHLVQTLSKELFMEAPGDSVGFYVEGKTTIKIHNLVISISSTEIEDNENVKTENTTKTDNKLEASFIQHDPPEDDTLEKILNDLHALIGHQKFKQQFLSFTNLLKVQNERKKRGLKIVNPSLHLVLYGPPGTGKTTIARLVGRLYKQLGYLKRGHVLETDRGGLVGAYLGQTAFRVNDAIEQALDGVLFIDEAYAFAVEGSSNDYGKEVVQVLLKQMEDSRDRLAVILAGYTDEMKFFIELNPGLKSRFSLFFYFDHYTPPQLASIFHKFCQENDYILDERANSGLLAIFENAYENRNKNFGNGRYVRTVFESSIEKQANRIANNLKEIKTSSLSLITPVDLSEGQNMENK